MRMSSNMQPALVLGGFAKKLLAGFIECDLVTGSPKQPSDRDAKRWIVVDYVDGCLFRGHPVRALAERNTLREQPSNSQAREERR